MQREDTFDSAVFDNRYVSKWKEGTVCVVVTASSLRARRFASFL